MAPITIINWELIEGLPQLMGDRPVVIGHFDLIKIFSAQHEPAGFVQDKIERNVEAAVQHGCVFEVNARAFKKGLDDPYPGSSILALVQQYGGEVTFGDDSHGPEQVGLYYDRSIPVVKQYFDHVVAFEKDEVRISKVTLPLT